jgi:hypothetical protein
MDDVYSTTDQFRSMGDNVTRPKSILLFAFLLVLLMISKSSAWVPVDSISSERLWFYDEGDSLALAYVTSHDLHDVHPQITRAIINIHGASRESEEAYERVIDAGDDHDRPLWDHVAVICPQFLFTTDIDSHNVSDSLLYWNTFPEIGPSWCYGEISKNNNNFPRPFRVDSYTCLDSLATLVLESFPNLENLVFAGHSAGARYMQRYPMVTRWDLDLDESAPRLLYTYGNPAVYAYIGPERHVEDNWNEFAIPPAGVIEECPEYDEWPFGLQEPFPYFDDMTEVEIQTNYANRHVVQWLSELDTTSMDGGSQVSCQAMISGDQHRLQRGTIFYNHVQFFYDGAPDLFVSAIVPGLGHFGNAVYRSEVGRNYLFDYYHPVMPGEEVELSGELSVPNPETVAGIIEFSVLVENHGEETRTGDIWVKLVGQNGSPIETGWIHEIVYEPGMEFTRSGLEFMVPEGFPLGNATLYLNVGSYPDAITTFDSVPVTISSTTSIEGEFSNLPPDQPRISTIAPNPFNAATNLVVEVPIPTALKIAVYDVLGRDVMTVMNGAVGEGSHTYSIRGDRMASGIYFVRATSPTGYEEVRKILLVP